MTRQTTAGNRNIATAMMIALLPAFTVLAGEVCEFAPANCHPADQSGGRISTAGIVVCADDFRFLGGCCRGDTNGDGNVNMFDIDPFVDALRNQSQTCEADLDCSGHVDNFDIDPFILAVLNGSCAICPGDDAPAVLSDACWWGAHVASDSTNDDFQITYRADNGGGPGAAICGPFRQNAGTLSVNSVLTGLVVDGSYAEREYHGAHAPCTLSRDECYWIEITNHATDTEWLWEFGAGGNGRAVRDGVNTIGDFALCLGEVLGDDTTCIGQ